MPNRLNGSQTLLLSEYNNRGSISIAYQLNNPATGIMLLYHSYSKQRKSREGHILH